MKKILRFIIPFALGFALALGVQHLTRSEIYDLAIYRGQDYEVWVSNEVASPFPMSTFKHTVRFRKICPDSGTICSNWEKVAEFELDGPSRASDFEFIQRDSQLILKLPENVIVERNNNKWTTKNGQ